MSLNPFAGAVQHKASSETPTEWPDRVAPKLALPYLVGTGSPRPKGDPWQERMITDTLRLSSAILAGEQGVGKSIAGSAFALWSRDNGFKATLWVCPPVMVPTAVREMGRFTPDLTVTVLRGQTPSDLPEADVYVCPDSVIAYWADALIDSKVIQSVVVDEAHRMGRKSARAEAMQRITSTLDPAAPNIWMTGTPISNHPIEMGPLLIGLNRIEQWRHSESGTALTQFLDAYCPKVGDWGGRGVDWDRIPELHARLTGSTEEAEIPGEVKRSGEVETIKVKTSQTKCMVRLRTMDVLDLDERQLMGVALEMDSRTEVLYQRAETDLRRFLKEVCGYSPSRLSGVDRAEALVRLSTLRRLCSDGVVESSVAYAKSLIENALPGDIPEKVVLFTTHRDAQQAMHKALGKALATGPRKATPDLPASPAITAEERVRFLWGSQSAQSKQKAVDEFQKVDGPCLGLIANIGSGSVGITLTASRHVVMSGLPWHKSGLDQCVSRCHRHGATAGRPVIGHIVLPQMSSGIESVVTRVWGLIEAKGSICSSVIDGEVGDDLLVGSDVADDLIAQYCS